MEDEAVLKVRAVREKIAGECDYNIHRLSERFRKGEEQMRKEGWKFYDGKPEKKEAMQG